MNVVFKLGRGRRLGLGGAEGLLGDSHFDELVLCEEVFVRLDLETFGTKPHAVGNQIDDLTEAHLVDSLCTVQTDFVVVPDEQRFVTAPQPDEVAPDIML